MAETFSTKGTGISNVTHILNRNYGYPEAAGNQDDAQNHPNPVDTSGGAGNTVLTEPIVTIPGAYTSYEIPTESGNDYTIDPNVGAGTGTVITVNPIIGDGSTQVSVVSVSTTDNNTFQVSIDITGTGSGSGSGGGEVNMYDSWPTIGEAIANAKQPGMFTYGSTYATANEVNKYAATTYFLTSGYQYRMYIDTSYGDGQAITIHDLPGTGAIWDDLFIASQSGWVQFVSMYTGTGDGSHRVLSTAMQPGQPGGVGSIMFSNFGGVNLSPYYSGDTLEIAGTVYPLMGNTSQIYVGFASTDECIRIISLEMRIDGGWYECTSDSSVANYAIYHYPDMDGNKTIDIESLGVNYPFDENTEYDAIRLNFLSFPKVV